MKKKLYVLLMSLTMVVTMMPLQVFADTAGAGSTEVTSESKATEEAKEDATKDSEAESNQSSKDESTKDSELSGDEPKLYLKAVGGDVDLSMESVGMAPDDYTFTLDKAGRMSKFHPSDLFYTIRSGVTIGLWEECDSTTGSIGGYWRFKMQGKGKIEAYGDLNAMAYNDDCPYAYRGLFQNCTSLVIAPGYSSNGVGERAFESTFEGCTNLRSVNPITYRNAAPYCCESMFEGCTSLERAPQLPTTLAEGCYNKMFKGCTSLEEPPSLDSTKLTVACYANMFEGCTGLKESPYLPAKELTFACYANMFSGCSRLNNVNVSFIKWNDKEGSTEDWLKGVAGEGTFSGPVGVRDSSHIPVNWRIVPPDDFLGFKAADGAVDLSMDKSGDAPDVTYEYFFDGAKEWKEFIPGKDVIEILKDETVYFRASKEEQVFPANPDGYLKFVMKPKDGNGKIEASGSIMSLVNYNPVVEESGFTSLFSNCDILTKAPLLPAVEVGRFAYASMFEGCTCLMEAPNLPATKLGDGSYQAMFKGCESLTKMPKLPAEKIFNFTYKEMFEGCTNLTEVSELPAWQIGEWCYMSMFEGCTSLVKAQDILPAENLSHECYTHMFDGCVSLIKAPDLPAQELNTCCYNYMFAGCTNLKTLTVGFIEWDPKAYTVGWLGDTCAEGGVFYAPEELKKPEERSANTIPENWKFKQNPYLKFTAVDGDVSLSMEAVGAAPNVSYEYSKDTVKWNEFALGQSSITIRKGQKIYLRIAKDNHLFPGCSGGYWRFVMKSNDGKGKIEAGGSVMSLVSKDCSETDMKSYGFYGLFRGCTCLTKAPELSATTLAEACYSNMFYGCTSLTEAPDLPVMKLAKSCYGEMFARCSNLSKVSVGFTEWDEDECATQDWLAYVAANGEFASEPELDSSLSKRGPSHIPSNWAVKGRGLCFKAVGGDVQIYMEGDGDNLRDVTYKYYSSDKKWKDFKPGETKITIPEGEKIYFRAATADQGEPSELHNVWKFVMDNGGGTGTVEASGNIMSLVGWNYKGRTFVGDNGFGQLFENCDILTKAPEMPATQVGDSAYWYMFSGCKNLIEPPKILPAKKVLPVSYAGMFEGCEKLLKAPEIPAMELDNNCYSQMFKGCISLTEAPVLPATKLAACCYNEMFHSCTNLSKINVGFTDWDENDNATQNWLKGVADKGTFICPEGLDTTTRDVSHIPENWIVPNYLNFKAVDGNVTLSMVSREHAPDVSYEYSLDMVKWNKFTPDVHQPPKVTISKDQKIYFRAVEDGQSFPGTKDGHLRFVMNDGGSGGKIEADGNIMSLVSKDCTQTKMENYGFYGLFEECKCLSKAPVLPAKTLAENCYATMFEGCSNLTKAPELLAGKLTNGCYYEMFRNCSSLNSVSVGFTDWAEEMHATANWLLGVSEEGTFCSPDDLDKNKRDESHIPAKWGSGYDYLRFKAVDENARIGMKFYDETEESQEPTDLKYEYSFDKVKWETFTPGDLIGIEIPRGETIYFRAAKDEQEFPAYCHQYTGGAGWNFYMTGDGKIEADGNVMSLVSKDCTKKVVDCEGGFWYLFRDCNNLIKAPQLPATDLYDRAYSHMFCGCTNLEETPELPATKLDLGPDKGNVYESMFENCSSIVKAPKILPAEEVPDRSYASMFKNCSSLKESPYLPSDNLGYNAYTYMFSGCSSLRSIKVGFTYWGREEPTDGWVCDVPTEGVFNCPAELDTSLRGTNGIPYGWRVNLEKITFASESEGSANGGFYDENGKRIESLEVPKDTEVVVHGQDPIHERVISIAYPNGSKKTIYARAEEGSKIAKFEKPESTITSDCEFKAFFGEELPTVTLENDESSTGTGGYYIDGEKVTSVNVPHHTTFVTEKVDEGTIEIVFSSGTKVTVKADEDSIISGFVPPDSRIEGNCKFTTNFLKNTPGERIKINLEKENKGEAYGEYYLEGITKPITELELPKGTTFEADDKGSKEIPITFKSGDKIVAKVYAKAGKGSEIGHFKAPEGALEEGSTFTTTFVTEMNVVLLATDRESTGTGKYYYDDKEIRTIMVPYNTRFTTERIDDSTLQINFDGVGVVTVKAEEWSVIDSYAEPSCPITDECVFRTKFMQGQPGERIRINLNTDDSGTGTGEYHVAGKQEPITYIDVPEIGTTFEIEGVSVGHDKIIFKKADEEVATVYVDAGENSEIASYTTPEGELEQGSTFTTKFDLLNHNIRLGSDKGSTGTGVYIKDEKKTNKVIVPYNTVFTVEKIDDKTAQINFDNIGIVTIKADEDSIIEDIKQPECPITEDSVFKTKFTKVAALANDENRIPQKSSPKVTQVNGVNAKALNAGQVQIAWNGNGSKDTSYQVYASTKKDGKYTKIGTVTNGKTKYIQNIMPAQSGKKYYYKVRASVKDTTGKWKYGTFSKVDYAYPRVATPTGFKAWASNKNTCNCSWNKVAGSNIKYLVYRGTKPTGNWGKAIATTTKTSYTNKSMKSGQRYYYMVRAVQTVNGNNYYSAYSAKDYAYLR